MRGQDYRVAVGVYGANIAGVLTHGHLGGVSPGQLQVPGDAGKKSCNIILKYKKVPSSASSQTKCYLTFPWENRFSYRTFRMSYGPVVGHD